MVASRKVRSFSATEGTKTLYSNHTSFSTSHSHSPTSSQHFEPHTFLYNKLSRLDNPPVLVAQRVSADSICSKAIGVLPL